MSELLRDLRAYFQQCEHHYECDDSWYSCPLSPDGCADDRRTGCTCGLAEMNEKKAEMLKRIDAALSPDNELSDAIAKAYWFVQNTMTTDANYKTLCDHLSQLLIIQQERAKESE